ncbi:hypothetical protein Hanom_Chr01g00043311 [Helianthus anomalus]
MFDSSILYLFNIHSAFASKPGNQSSCKRRLSSNKQLPHPPISFGAQNKLPSLLATHSTTESQGLLGLFS